MDLPETKYSCCGRADSGLDVLLTRVFQQWRTAGVVFLILRNYEELPSATANDVDVLVGTEQFGLAERIMVQSAEACGYHLHNRVEFATTSYFFHHLESLRQIQIDLFTETKWHTFELLPTEDVLARRSQRDLFSIPSPVDEAVISLLARLIYQGYVREKYKEKIVAGFQSDPTLATTLLANAFGPRLASQVVQLSLMRNWPAVETLAKPLRRSLLLRAFSLRTLSTLRSLMADFGRFFRRLTQPGGLVIVVLGADGSGKSTVAAQAIQNLRNTFNPGKMLNVHWKPVVFLKNGRKCSAAPNVNPHGQKPRGRCASLAYLGFHWFEYVIGSHFLFRKTTFKNGLVLVDRYYYDFFVDQRRFRLQAPAALVRVLFRAVKSPDLVFLFDASAHVLQMRKQEVPFEETERQVLAYRQVVSALPNGRMLDASGSIEKIAGDMTRSILTFLRDRAADRRGRPTLKL